MNDKNSGGFRLGTVLLEKTAVCDLSDDFTLPDYMPPVGRVISTECVPSPPSHYLGAGNAEFAGPVRYRLLYEGVEESDGEGGGQVYCAEFPAEYDLTLPLEIKEGTPPVVRADAEADNVSARVTAPRRVTMRSRVRVSVLVTGESTCDCMGLSAADDGDVRTLEGRGSCFALACGMGEPTEYKDTVRPEELPAGEVRVIGCRGEVFVAESAPAEGGVSCRGEVNLRLLLCREGTGERPFCMTRRIPVTAQIPLDTALPEDSRTVGVCVRGTCVSAAAVLTDGGLDCTAAVVWRAGAYGLRDFSYLRDMYSRTLNCECARRDLSLRVPLGAFNGNVSVSGVRGEEENGKTADLNGVRVLSARAWVLPDVRTEITGERNDRLTAAVSGRVRCSLLTDDGARVNAAEWDVPFRFTADAPLPPEVGADARSGVTAEVTVWAAGCRGRMDGDRPAADCELCYCLRLWRAETVSAVSEVRFGSPRRGRTAGNELSRITVCYPAPGETLWGIAKKYGADIVSVAEDNGLDLSLPPDSPQSLGGTNFVIV